MISLMDKTQMYYFYKIHVLEAVPIYQVLSLH